MTAATFLHMERDHLIAPDFGAESLNGAGGKTPPHVVIRTLYEILQDPTAIAPPAPVIPRLAWRGRTTLLSAREKEGKSTLAAAAAAAVSAGRPFLDQRTRPGVVLWVGLEEHVSDIARRFVTLHADPDRVGIVVSLPNELADLEAAVAETEPALVVIDTLPALAAHLVDDAGASANWTPLMCQLTALARTSDAALLVLHHARKSDGAYRDSTAIGANVDMILEMKGSVEDPAVRKFAPKGRWLVHDFSVRYTGVDFEMASGGLSTETRVLFFIQEHPDCSQRAVREGVPGRNEEKDKGLANLLRSGVVRDNGDDRGHRYRATRSASEGVPGGVPMVEACPSMGTPPEEGPCPA